MINFDLSELRNSWKDPIVPRKFALQASCGIITPKSLANLDCLGEGPQNAFRIGRQTVYPRDAFFDWLASRAKPIEQKQRPAPENQAA
jgi:hypothetical protein